MEVNQERRLGLFCDVSLDIVHERVGEDLAVFGADFQDIVIDAGDLSFDRPAVFQNDALDSQVVSGCIHGRGGLPAGF